MIPPTFPTLSCGAIKDGIDHATGADAERPQVDKVIQATATRGFRVKIGPSSAMPTTIPPTSTDWRTRLSLFLRLTNVSTSQPPKKRSLPVAQNQGIDV